MLKVILIGPRENDNGVYGGGIGGYIINFKNYVEGLSQRRVEVIPLGTYTRSSNSTIEYIKKSIVDLFFLPLNIVFSNYSVLHILGRYRGFVYFEVVYILISLLFQKTVVYEIKAGSFARWFSNIWLQSLFLNILRKTTVLCEGQRDVLFLKDHKVKATHIPNFSSFTASEPLDFTTGDKLVVSFVGFATQTKGVRDSLDVLKNLVNKGYHIQYNLIGAIDTQISSYIQNGNFVWVRKYGLKISKDINQILNNSHIYLYLSNHAGEGHNNSLTEAMACGNYVITTNNGFSSDVVGDTGVVLPYDYTLLQVEESLIDFLENSNAKLHMRKQAIAKVDSFYRPAQVFDKLINIYNEAVSTKSK